MKFPKHAKKVFDGVIFDVYQWEQELFDGSKTTYEGLDRPDTIGVIGVTEDCKILVLNEIQSSWKNPTQTLPVGKAEPGEEDLEAAKREFLEETGHATEEWELYRVFHPSSKMNWTMAWYIARECRKVSEQNLDPGEKIEVHTMDFQEFLEWADQENFRHQELQAEFVRAKYHPPARAEWEKRLFGKAGE